MPVPDWFHDKFLELAAAGVTPGESITKHAAMQAELFGVPTEETLWDLLTVPRPMLINEFLGDEQCTVVPMPGHVGYKPLSEEEIQDPACHPTFTRGPSPGCADIVLVGKHPGYIDSQVGYYCSSEVGAVLRDVLRSRGLTHLLDNAYITSACKFVPPIDGKFKKGWVKETLWLLMAELHIIQPKFVLLLGNEAISVLHTSKAKMSVTKARGTLIPVTPYGTTTYNTFATVNPSAVQYEPTQADSMGDDLTKFAGIIAGKADTNAGDRYDLRTQVLRTVPEIKAYVEKELAAGRTKFAIDCEWCGRNPYAGGKLLTIQLASAVDDVVLIPIHNHYWCTQPPESKPLSKRWRAKWEYPENLSWFKMPECAELSVLNLPKIDDEEYPLLALEQDGVYEVLNAIKPCFNPIELAQVVQLLRDLLLRPDVRVGGHNLRSDMLWLYEFGIDLVEQYVHGFDTMNKYHIMHEIGKQDLMTVCLRYTEAGRYDIEVDKWSKSVDIKEFGYGVVPEAVLYRYALADADVTLEIDGCLDYELSLADPRLADVYKRELLAGGAIVEMERTGFRIDKGRLAGLGVQYGQKLDEMTEALRKQIHWPEFNFRSLLQLKELLFGEEYNRKASTGTYERRRPAGAMCLHLTPIKSTGKPSQPWDKVVAGGLAQVMSPSTDKESLGILSEQNPIAATLRDIKFIDQVCKMFVGHPEAGESDDEDDDIAGLAGKIDLDGRLRTRIRQATETGRMSSADPNLQNIPKRREPSLAAMFAKKPFKIRSIFMADEGEVLVEGDYVQAELMVLALLSGDMKFYKALTEVHPCKVVIDLESNKPLFWLDADKSYVGEKPPDGTVLLPGANLGVLRQSGQADKLITVMKPAKVETRKWASDLHAERAIGGFRMPYVPFVHGPPKPYVEATASDKRVAAKSVSFGIPYGRSAAAIARELQQDGVIIQVPECQAMIDGFLKDYEYVAEFLRRCGDVANSFGCLINPAGRWRRFPKTNDREQQAANAREAANFPIQGQVAECLNDALSNFRMYRKLMQSGQVSVKATYRMMLAIHDAAMLAVPVASIDPVMRNGGIFDLCMSHGARIPPPDPKVCGGLYANANPDMFPYALAIDKSIFTRWNESPNPDELESMGVPEQYIKRK